MAKEKLLDTEVIGAEDLAPKADNIYNDIMAGCDNPEETQAVLRQAAGLIYKQFKLDFTSEAGLKCLAVLWYLTWREVLNFIAKQRKKYQTYSVNLCNKFTVGYTNAEDEEQEKVGNLVPLIEHLGNTTGAVNTEDDVDDNCITRTVEWNSQMIAENPEAIRKIAAAAFEACKKEADILLPTSEAIFPLFITVYEMLVSYMTIRRAENDEFLFKINFENCFDIIAQLAKDGSTMIGFVPSMDHKLSTKSDETVTSTHEDE